MDVWDPLIFGYLTLTKKPLLLHRTRSGNDGHSNAGDGLTKPLERVKSLQFKELVNIHDRERMELVDIADGFVDEGIFQCIKPGLVRST